MRRLTFCVLFALALGMSSAQSTQVLENSLKEYLIIPDLISTVPTTFLHVYYSKLNVSLGDIIKPSKLQIAPRISWIGVDPQLYFTLFMVDLDYPSAKHYEDREFQHWVVVNMNGNDLVFGESLTEYIAPIPRKTSGLHRYVFLIYRQASRLIFEEKYISVRSGLERKKFSIANFVEKYNLGKPVAVNFFQSEYDSSVLENEKLLGLRHGLV